MISSIAIGISALLGGAIATAPAIRSEASKRPAQVIYIPEDYSDSFNAESGDTIVLIMKPEESALFRCNDAGGALGINSYTGIWTCWGVDF
jgi:hypothetical protein